MLEMTIYGQRKLLCVCLFSSRLPLVIFLFLYLFFDKEKIRGGNQRKHVSWAYYQKGFPDTNMNVCLRSYGCVETSHQGAHHLVLSNVLTIIIRKEMILNTLNQVLDW